MADRWRCRHKIGINRSMRHCSCCASIEISTVRSHLHFRKWPMIACVVLRLKAQGEGCGGVKSLRQRHATSIPLSGVQACYIDE